MGMNPQDLSTRVLLRKEGKASLPDVEGEPVRNENKTKNDGAKISALLIVLSYARNYSPFYPFKKTKTTPRSASLSVKCECTCREANLTYCRRFISPTVGSSNLL